MKLPTSALPLLLVALLLPPTATATIAGTLINNCPYPIYAKTTRGGGYDSHELARVAPHGGRYRAAVHAHANGAGVTLKAQRQPDAAWPDVYQAEYAQSDTPYTRDGRRDWAWYDLSTVDGAPFAAEWRRLEGRQGEVSRS
ncbi:hypothetical protein SLS58_003193 [Diplodia intermedia]|uniref:Uncharacterized protein n=1 Tax=Diplodia intermedia TaxID=856260 RepID=A0ABR3TX51_9PEZI